MEKQPITTAPKDGTWVLLFGGDPCEDFLCETPTEMDLTRPVVAKWDALSFAGINEGGWVYAYWDSNWRSEYVNPTHWMPLELITERKPQNAP